MGGRRWGIGSASVRCAGGAPRPASSNVSGSCFSNVLVAKGARAIRGLPRRLASANGHFEDAQGGFVPDRTHHLRVSPAYQLFMLALCLFAIASLGIQTILTLSPDTAVILQYADLGV